MSASNTPWLDWPNHREGSTIADPIRFEDKTDDLIERKTQEFADDYCESHRKNYGSHSIDEIDEDASAYFKSEEDKLTDDEFADYVASHIEVDRENNVIWCKMPDCMAMWRAPVDKEAVILHFQEEHPIEEHSKEWGGFWGEFAGKANLNQTLSAQDQQGEYQQGATEPQADPSMTPSDLQNVSPYTQSQFVPTGSQIRYPVPKQEGDDLTCPHCGYVATDDTDFENHLDAHWKALPLPKDEELRDPRVEPDAEPKEPGAGLSPEGQKIAGTDPESKEKAQSMKPKLEVDVSDKVTTLGKTGSGKTNLIKVLMTDILKDYQFILLDAIGNMAEYEGQSNVEYHQTNPTDTAAVDEIIYAALERGDCMVVVDEVDRYDSKKGTMMNELVNVGRNYNVGGVFAARRTADVDKDILANSKFIFTFQHILPQDLDVLIDWFAQPEETFRDLQEYEAILFKDGEQVWVGKVPEKPTTKPTKKPVPPKKPKGKSKEPAEKGKEPAPAEVGGEPEDPKDKGTPKKPMDGEGAMQPEPPETPNVPPVEKGEEGAAQDKDTETGMQIVKQLEQDFYHPENRDVSQMMKHLDWLVDTGLISLLQPPNVDEEVFQYYSAYIKDMAEVSESPEDITLTEECPFKCEFDGKSFKYEKDYLNHLNTHAGR